MAACVSPPEEQSANRSGEGAQTGRAPEVAALRAAADARLLTPELRAAAVAHDPALRGLAVELLGRLEDDAVIPMLELALADREPGIRLDAARGLARSWTLSRAAREAVLLGAYAAAPSSWERAELVALLAEVATGAGGGPVAQELRSEDALGRAAGCAGLQRLAHRGHAPLAEDAERVVALLEAPEPEVARACAAALLEPVARETLSEPGRARALRAAQTLARASELETATLAVELLGELGGRGVLDVLQGLVGSREPRIAIESVRALERLASPAELAKVAEQELTRVAADGAERGARVHVLLMLLAALERKPDQPDVAGVAEHGLRRLQALPEESAAHARSARALLHCAAARLADTARHWPKELLSCGHGAMPEALREVWTAQVLASVDGSDELRAVQLGRLLEKSGQQTRIAALVASATLPVHEAAPLLRRALRDKQWAARAAALRLIGARPALRELEEPVRIPLSELLEAGVEAHRAPELAVAWIGAARTLGKPVAAIKGAPGSTEHAGDKPAAAAEVFETTTLSAVAPDLIERVTQLARHPARAVREPAQALLSEWAAEVPSDVDPIEAPLAVDRMPGQAALFHVKLLTTAGALELELDLARAPVAAVRFIELARSGALDGVPVAELAPGRAVAFAPTLSAEHSAWRHEDLDATVERGSVLLQDHGRDAVGPGFALMLARAPLLDGRAAQLGKMTAGLEVADRLNAADVVLEAQVTIGTR